MSCGRVSEAHTIGLKSRNFKFHLTSFMKKKRVLSLSKMNFIWVRVDLVHGETFAEESSTMEISVGQLSTVKSS